MKGPYSINTSYGGLPRSIRARAEITDLTPAGTTDVPFGPWGHDPGTGGANSEIEPIRPSG